MTDLLGLFVTRAWRNDTGLTASLRVPIGSCKAVAYWYPVNLFTRLCASAARTETAQEAYQELSVHATISGAAPVVASVQKTTTAPTAPPSAPFVGRMPSATVG